MPKNNYDCLLGAKTFQIMPNTFPDCLAIHGGAGKYSTVSATDEREFHSVYSLMDNNQTVALGTVTLNRVITKALFQAIQAELFPDQFSGFGICDGAKTYVGEFKETDPLKPNQAETKHALCVYNAKDGTFLIGEVIGAEDRAPRPISNLTQDPAILDTTILVYAMMGYLLQNDELRSCFDVMCENFTNALEDPTGSGADLFKKAMYVANDNILCRMKKIDSSTGKPEIALNSSFGILNSVHLKSDMYNAVESTGKLTFFNQGKSKKKQELEKKDINEMRGMYSIPGISYTEEEQKLIPTLPKDTVVVAEALEIAKMIQESTKLKHPKRNFCLFGPSGLGKTTITQQVAILLGMPYIIQGCNADTDASDLVVQAVPIESGTVTNTSVQMPSAMDIAMMPAMAYQRITGESKDDASDKDCFYALAKMLTPAGSGAKVRYEKANIIKGITKPYLVEVQEPSTMQKQGALTVLNSIMDDCRQITLPSGEVILRDPNSIIVMTTNMGYEGTRSLNQSVLSRCRKIKIDYPDEENDIVKFLSKSTDMKDKNVLKLMAKVFKKVRKLCEDNGITQGSYGYRELIDWADEAVLTSDENGNYDLLGSCKRTLLLSAAVDNEDDMLELEGVASAILDKK